MKNAFGKNNYTRAYQHFLEYGYAEYRPSSKYYNGDYYRRNNEVLRSFDSKRLLKHYLQYGVNEERYANTVLYNGNVVASGNTNASTYSISNNVLIINGVALTEYKIGSKCPNTYYSNVNGKSTYVGGSQCLGYARYVQRKLYGYDEFNDGGKYTDISGVISYKNVTADKIKSLVNSAGAGGHIHTNNNNGTNRHSLVIIGISADGFTITDGNSDGNLTVRYKTFTWQEYVNTYGKRGIQFINKYNG